MRRIHEVSPEESRRVHLRTYTINGEPRAPWLALLDDVFFNRMFADEARHDHLMMRIDRRVASAQKSRCHEWYRDRKMNRNNGRKPRRGY